MKLWSNRSIRSKTLIVFLSFVITLVVGLYHIISSTIDNLIQTEVRAFRAELETKSEYLRSSFQTYADEVHILSEISALKQLLHAQVKKDQKNFEIRKSDLQDLFKTFLETEESCYRLNVRDASGKFIFSAYKLDEKVSYEESDYDIISENFTVIDDGHHKEHFFISAPRLVKTRSGTNFAGLVFKQALNDRNTNEVLGYLELHVNIDQIISDKKISDTQYYVFDQKGYAFIYPDKKTVDLLSLESPIYIDEIDTQGLHHIEESSVYAHYNKYTESIEGIKFFPLFNGSQNKYYIFAKAPENAVLQSVTSLKNLLAKVAVAVLLIVAVIIFVGSTVIVSRVEKMKDELKKIESGDLSARLTVNSNDEISKIAISFNKTVEALSETLISRETIRTSEEFHRSIFKSSLIGNFIISNHGAVTNVNETALLLLESERTKVIGKQFVDLIDDFDENQLQTHEDKIERLKALAGQTLEVRMKCNSGAKPVYMSLTEISSLRTVFYYAAITDLSKEKALQNQLVRSEKLASIGSLAAGVAHEINNPLAVIVLYLEKIKKLVQSQKIDLDKVNEILEKQLQATERIRSIVNGLRIYARADDSSTEEGMNIHTEIKACIALIGELIKSKGVQFNLNLKAKNVVVKGSRGHFQQVLTNLISNAKDAVDHSIDKVISIETKDLENSVQIIISDTGSGIEKHTLKKIFDPFYTTKPVGKGTGLGLSIVHGIISDMKGKISVSSELGKGSSFIMEFPLASVNSREGSESKEEKYAVLKKIFKGTALVVDTHEELRKEFRDNLTDFGFNATAAVSGRDALEILAERPFDIIITALNMPGVDGVELIEMAKVWYPKIKSVLVTGNLDLNLDELTPEQIQSIDSILKKPFRVSELFQTIQKVMEDVTSDKAA